MVLLGCLGCLGCSTFRNKNEWPSPTKPLIKKVEIIPIKDANIEADGFYMDREDANDLADNVDEIKAYTKKLELLVKSMKKYYGDK